MYIVDDIAYASGTKDDIKIIKLKVIDNLCLLLTFSNLEMRIYDATQLLKYPAYQKLKDFSFFKQAYIEHGEIDVAPEEMYANSFGYEQVMAN